MTDRKRLTAVVREAAQSALLVAAVVAAVASGAVTLLGAAFVTRAEFEAEQVRLNDTRRLVRFVACSVVLSADMCQAAHGVSIDELLRVVE